MMIIESIDGCWNRGKFVYFFTIYAIQVLNQCPYYATLFYIIFSNPLLFTSQLTQDLSANIQIQIQIQIVCETPWISANLHFIYLKLCTRLEHYSWKNYILHTYSLHTSNYIYRVGALFLGGTTFTNLQFTY